MGKTMRDYLAWRLAFGVTTPSTNTVVQPEYDDMRPAGVTNHLAFRAQTYGELDDAFLAAAQNRDRMVLIEAIVPRLDSPDLLTELAQSASPDGTPRR